MQTIPI